MPLRALALCVVVAGTAVAQDGADAMAKKVEAALVGAAAKVGAEFEPLPGVARAFAARIERGLATCDRIDLEVRVREGGLVEIAAYPRLHGARLDPGTALDRPALLAKLAAPVAAIAPWAWATDDGSAVHASCSLSWDDTSTPAELERALLAVPAIDGQVPGLLAAFPPPLTEEQVTARLREAGAADEATRSKILAQIASYLPEVTPSATQGHSAFGKIAMNRQGTAFDAFRFRVPGENGERRLVWAFAYPPGTAKGWYIASVAGAAPKLLKFHRGRKYEGTAVPDEYATLLQRAETPLREGAEYVVWFQFKVETPVEMYVALGCYPFAKSDRDNPATLEKALGLEPVH